MHIFLAILAAFFMAAFPACAAGSVSLREVKSAEQQGNSVEFRLAEGLMRITVVAPHVIRVRVTGCSEFNDAPSYAVVNGTQREAPSFKLSAYKNRWEIVTEELKVSIAANPCRVSIFDKNGVLLNEDEPSFGITFTGNEVRCYKRLMEGERFFGLGEKTGWLDRRGSQYTMWNTDYPFYPKEQDPLYVSVPFFIGVKDHRAWGIFFDNTYRSRFNFGAGNDRFFWFGAEDGEMDYYFIWGPSMARVVSSYTDLTGRMELPPLWALGFQQSRWSYWPEAKVMNVAETFRRKEIPCDVIYLDIDYMKGYRVFTWDEKRFPAPEKMLARLAAMGFKIIPIIDPGVKADESYFAAKEGLDQDLFVKYPDGRPYRGEVWPSWAYFPDFTCDRTRAWWGEKLSALLALGIQGFWNDMNEPAVWGGTMPDLVRFHDEGHGADHRKIHNVYALAMAKATADALHKYSKNRHFILTRAGFAGTQRYAAVWTGDNVANEEHLRMACLTPQSMGLSGLAFVGSDVGGFGGYPSQDLYVRWMQLGALTPFFRAHSAMGTPDKEPWALGETAERLSREAIELRYRLLPYLYTEFRNASITGLPIMSPMVLGWQEDDECYRREAQLQFMAGRFLLAAPVLGEEERAKKLYLPEGKWLGWWDNRIHEGKRWITVDAPLDEIPLFIREGGIIPMQQPQQWVGEKKVEETELRIFPAERSEYDLYEDDGTTQEYRKGAYALTRIETQRKGNGITVRFSNLNGGYDRQRGSWLLHLHGMGAPASVTAGGRLLPKRALEEKDEGFAYDEKTGTLHVRVRSAQDLVLEVR
jgi:alpha-glucosidase